MNRIYHFIWNRKLHTPQVVSEFAHPHPRGGTCAGINAALLRECVCTSLPRMSVQHGSRRMRAMKNALISLAVVSGLGASAFALATPTLIGVLPATPGGSDWQAYYDPSANLTWLTNANAAKGSAYDTFKPDTGEMQWNVAKAWAASLDIDGVTGWRLPTTTQPDSSCAVQHDGQGQWVDCTGSEMGNLFYKVLGGTAYTGIQDHHNSNYALFSNIQVPGAGAGAGYWSATPYAPNPSLAWYFDFYYYGSQGGSSNTQALDAWAVYPGDAGALLSVPEPTELGMFGLGVLLIGGFVTLRRRGLHPGP